MTGSQFNRQRRWDRRVQPAYSAGVMDGFDARMAGHDRPEVLLSDYNLKFYFRSLMRRAQALTNATIARSRGRADGWDLADREVCEADIETEVTVGMVQLADWLRIQDRRGESWAA